MKRKVINTALGILIILFIVGIIGFYIYDVVCNGTPIAQNLFRTVSIVLILSLSFLRVFFTQKRKSIDVYEMAYSKEIGHAFKNKEFMRKKLLCAARLYDESNYRKALKYLFELYQAAESQRDAIPVLLFIALCYTDMGFNEQAIQTYYKLLELDEKNAQAHSNIGLLYQSEGDYKMALSHFDKSIECDPNNYYAYSNRASCYFRMNDNLNAEKNALKALEIKNNGIEAASLLVIIYAMSGDEENKQKYFRLSVTNGKTPDELNDAIEYFLKEKSENKVDENEDNGQEDSVTD